MSGFGPVNIAVEGITDEAVLRRVLEEAGLAVRSCFGKVGKSWLAKKIAGFNNAAQGSPWVVLVDLDSDGKCAPDLVRSWIPNISQWMHIRVAVPEVEAWLMGDRERLAQFLSVRPDRIPAAPEEVSDPKRALVDLARTSRLKEIREDMVPSAGSGRTVGPGYPAQVIKFASSAEGWRPAIAAENAPSLARCLRALSDLRAKLEVGGWSSPGK